MAPSPQLPATWRDGWRRMRDRWIANPAFRDWAARFPLTRPIARRRARAVFDLCAGFVYSQVLAACVRLRVLDALAVSPLTAVQMAARTGLTVEAATILLDAAVALGLADRRRGDRYGLGMLGASIAGNPAIVAMVEHHALFYADLRDPVALLRGEQGDTALAAYWPYAGATTPAGLPADRVAAYSTLMAASQSLIASQVVAAYALNSHRCVLDVGGGEGAFLEAVAEHVPALELKLFDLPAVAARATARFAATGLVDRATAYGGDFLTDALPAGADIVTLVRVLHDHDDTRVRTLLSAVRRALPAGGTVLIAEPLRDAPDAATVGAAYFAFYLLAMGRGRPRSVTELGMLLREAGFGDVREIATSMPLQTGLVVARAT